MRVQLHKSIFVACILLFLVLVGCEGHRVKEGKVRVGDIDMAYRVMGKGYPLVMIMGFSCTKDYWDERVLDAFAERYMVIVFDSRGMGWTSAGQKEFIMEQYADDTAGLMEALGIERAHVLGWSMGARIAQELVFRHPEKVNHLILHATDIGGPNTYLPDDKVTNDLLAALTNSKKMREVLLTHSFPEKWRKSNKKEFDELLQKDVALSSPENIQKQDAGWGLWKGGYDRLSNIESLTLLLTGDEDTITPPINSIKMVGEIPSASLVQIRGGGHGVMYQYPHKFTNIVMSFLDH